MIPNDFGPAAFVYSILWEISRDFYRRYHAAIPSEIILAEVEARLSSGSLSLPPEQIDFLLTFISQAYSYNQFVSGYGRQLIEKLLVNSRFAPTLSFGANGVDDAAEMYERISEAYAQSRVSMLQSVNVLDIARNPQMAHMPDMSPCGVNFVDSAMGGGFRPACLYGLLGGSGCFKTTLSIQIATRLAFQRRHTMYLTFEQTAAGMLTRKAFASLCGVPIDAVSVESLENRTLPNIERTDIAKDYLHFYDVTDPRSENVLSMVDDAIRQECSSERRPELVIIDWLGQMALMADTTGKAEEYKLIFTYLQYLLSLTSRYRIPILAVQQLAPGQLRSPKHKPSWMDAQGCKSFAVLCNTVFVLGTVDEDTGCQWFLSSKSRDTSPKSEIIRYEQSMSQLVCETDSFEVARSNMRGGAAFVERRQH